MASQNRNIFVQTIGFFSNLFGRLRQQFFWGIILVTCTTLIIFTLASSIIVDESWQKLDGVRKWLTGHWLENWVYAFGMSAQNDGLYGIFIGSLFSFMSLSFIYLFKIPHIRETTIQAIASGYYENFLSKVIESAHREYSNFRTIIVLPSYELVENPDIYWSRLKSIIEGMGFKLEESRSDEIFGRRIFTIYKRGSDSSLPVFIDLPSTLKVIRKIIELEAHMPAGRVSRRKWWRRRFQQLRNEFKSSVIDHVGDPKWGRLLFVEGDTVDDFSEKLKKIINEFDEISD